MAGTVKKGIVYAALGVALLGSPSFNRIAAKALQNREPLKENFDSRAGKGPFFAQGDLETKTGNGAPAPVERKNEPPSGAENFAGKGGIAGWIDTNFWATIAIIGGLLAAGEAAKTYVVLRAMKKNGGQPG